MSGNIERKIDKILAKQPRNRRSRIYNPKTKLVMSIGTTLLILALVAGATLFSTFVTHTENITVESYLFFDGEPMGDLITSDSFNTYGNVTTERTHQINYTDTADGDILLDFNFTGDALLDGTITAGVYYEDTEITELLISPGNSYNITCKYYIHPYAVPDTYSVDMEISLA